MGFKIARNIVASGSIMVMLSSFIWYSAQEQPKHPDYINAVSVAFPFAFVCMIACFAVAARTHKVRVGNMMSVTGTVSFALAAWLFYSNPTGSVVTATWLVIWFGIWACMFYWKFDNSDIVKRQPGVVGKRVSDDTEYYQSSKFLDEIFPTS